MSAIYIPGFIGADRASEMFSELWNQLNWEKRGDAPRREYWTNLFDRDYSYGSGAGLRTYHAQETHHAIDECSLALINHADVQVDYEGCFLNGYEGAHDWLGWHEDDDPGIDHSKAIAIVTLYGGEGVDRPRSIQFAPKVGVKDNGKPILGDVTDLPLEQGSLCLMPAGFQATHQHRIPKAGFQSKSRISLTFRSLLP